MTTVAELSELACGQNLAACLPRSAADGMGDLDMLAKHGHPIPADIRDVGPVLAWLGVRLAGTAETVLLHLVWPAGDRSAAQLRSFRLIG